MSIPACARLFRGSKTEKLLTASPCPVFVAH